MRDGRLLLTWFLLIPALYLLPSCSLVPSSKTLEGFPPDTAQKVQYASSELYQLRQLESPTPSQQTHIGQLQQNLQQFEQDVIRAAGELEQQERWHDAQRLLHDAARILPGSHALNRAQHKLAGRRQLREARVRMELEIHQGEQLLKDLTAYQHLQQLEGPGLLNWLELKNFNRKRRASARALQEDAHWAMEQKEYALAERALKTALALYGDDLPLDPAERANMETILAQTEQKLRPVKPRRPTRASPAKVVKAPVAELQQALNAGDLASAQQYLTELQQLSPPPRQLDALQQRFQSQLNSRVTGAIKRGNELYSQGKTKQALRVWREVAALAPENVELQSNIARAEKLLENLRALSAPSNPGP